MERGSAKHSPRLDDELEREAIIAARANPPVRPQDFPDPDEPPEHGNAAPAPGAEGASQPDPARPIPEPPTRA
jgi:hypothetical protein